ncbi:hypothetical protein LTR95_014819 [Oleoguttula sp. CCFEE 5521]
MALLTLGRLIMDPAMVVEVDAVGVADAGGVRVEAGVRLPMVATAGIEAVVAVVAAVEVVVTLCQAAGLTVVDADAISRFEEFGLRYKTGTNNHHRDPSAITTNFVGSRKMPKDIWVYQLAFVRGINPQTQAEIMVKNKIDRKALFDTLKSDRQHRAFWQSVPFITDCDLVWAFKPLPNVGTQDFGHITARVPRTQLFITTAAVRQTFRAQLDTTRTMKTLVGGPDTPSTDVELADLLARGMNALLTEHTRARLDHANFTSTTANRFYVHMAGVNPFVLAPTLDALRGYTVSLRPG